MCEYAGFSDGDINPFSCVCSITSVVNDSVTLTKSAFLEDILYECIEEGGE